MFSRFSTSITDDFNYNAVSTSCTTFPSQLASFDAGWDTYIPRIDCMNGEDWCCLDEIVRMRRETKRWASCVHHLTHCNSSVANLSAITNPQHLWAGATVNRRAPPGIPLASAWIVMRPARVSGEILANSLSDKSRLYFCS